MRKRKTYERLREKQLEIYKKEIEAENAKNIDDFVSASIGVETYE